MRHFPFVTVSTKRKDPFQYVLQVKSQLSAKEAEEEEGVDNKMNQIAGQCEQTGKKEIVCSWENQKSSGFQMLILDN